MKHTYSLNNLKQSKNAHELQNFCVYPSDFPFQSGCISSKCSTKQIFGITSAKGFSNRKNSNFNLNNNNKNNAIQLQTKQYKKNHSIGTNNNQSDFNKKDKDKNLINIRLNIKSEIINNNFSEKKEHTNLCKFDMNKIIKEKNQEIMHLKQEIQETRSQIEKITKQNVSINDEISHSEIIMNELVSKYGNNNLIVNTKTKQKLQTKKSTVLSKNVKQYFKNLFLKNSKSLSKATTPTSRIHSSNLRKISYNMGKHFNYFGGNIIDVDTLLPHSPRLRSSDYVKDSKTITKSNSLILNGNNKKNIVHPKSQETKNKNKKIYNHQLQKKSNQSLNNSSTSIKSGLQNEIENVKIRTETLLNKYFNICKGIL